jgi:hypothetical protein
MASPFDRSVTRHVALVTNPLQLTTVGSRPRYSLAFIDDGTIQSITASGTIVTIPTTGTTASTNIVVEDTGNASVATVLTLSHVLSSGTPAPGIGTGMTYYAQVTGGPLAIGSATFYTTNVGVGTVSSVFSLRTRIAGVVANRLTIDDAGDVISEGRVALRNGTAFSATLTSTPTADRVLTLPDATDTLVTLSEAQALSNKTLASDLAAGGFTVSGLREPTAASDAATKNYVDVSASGLQPKDNVVVLSPINVNLAAPGANLDGVAMAPGDRFAAFAQSTGTQTGLYEWNGAAVAATRTTDFALGTHQSGAYFGVDSGTSAGVTYRVNNPSATDVVGTDPLTVVTFQFAPVDGPVTTPSLRTLGTGALQAAAGNDARLLANGEMGRVCVVDQILGSDATGARSGLPFATITAALAAALSGDCVWVMPGTYSEALTLPSGVSVRGIGEKVVTIQQLLVTADTDLITMGENSHLEEVTLRLTSAEHHTLRGIVWPGTTTATALWHASTLYIENSTAPIGGTSNVYGCHVTGTGVSTDKSVAISAVGIHVHSIGSGSKRAFFVSGAATAHVHDFVFHVSTAGGAGTFIGAETADAGAVLQLHFGSSDGATADISRTAGSLDIGSVNLVNANANGLGFTATLVAGLIPMVYADPGATPSGTRYMRPGTATVSATEQFLRIPGKTVIRSISVRAATGPGDARTDTWTVRINGVDTVVAASLTAAATTAVTNTTSAGSPVAFDLSVKQVCAAGSTTTDVAIVVGLY